ncbi:MAG: DUF3862 domain-containing protein [Planctomycetota bacterium]|nr:DUF3862 domain-containing protein [Planctomycetaceae bacterium]MDQ3330426.1 DUF3862 domain-containing protein [Planctomycetota bacterium]
MNEVRRGAGMGLVLGIIAAVVILPAIGMLFLCGGCATATVVGTTAVEESRREAERVAANRPPLAVPAEETPTEETDRTVTAPGSRKVDKATVITTAEYNQLNDGMTYDEVYEVIGYHGKEMSRNKIAGHETVMFAWQNRNGTNANVMFQNDRLVSRAQFGLPSGPSPLNVEKSRQEAEATVTPESRPMLTGVIIDPVAEAKEEARRRQEMNQEREEEAALKAQLQTELDEILSAPEELKSAKSIDAIRENLSAFSDSHAGTAVAEKAKAENEALTALRLAFVFAESSQRDATPRFRKVISDHPRTLAARAAEAKIAGK